MLESRYLGVDPRLIPPELGPLAVIVEDDRVHGLIDERQMDRQLIGLIEQVAAESMEALASFLAGAAAPHIGEVRIERVRGLPLQGRLIKPEITAEGVTALRVPEHSISPAVAAAFTALGTRIMSSLVLPRLVVPRLR